MFTVSRIAGYDTINTPKDDKACVCVYFSGCSIKCEGCFNPLLQNKSHGKEHSVDSLSFAIGHALNAGKLDTVALMGGEPLEQDYNDLYKLVQRIYSHGNKIWLYTGYEFEDIPSKLLPFLYTIKCGRYIKELHQDGIPASSNQKFYRFDGKEWKEISYQEGK